jgi:hypothetical protein
MPDRTPTEADRLRRLIRDGLRFLVIQPRANGDRVYESLREAAEETPDV